MTDALFEELLNWLADVLTKQAQTNPEFNSSPSFEKAVRKQAAIFLNGNPKNKNPTIKVDMNPPAQGFPDIVLLDKGIEVKYTDSDNWRTIANSVRESDRAPGVKRIVILEAKMGGTPLVKWKDYGDAIIHVRSSHDPRFEVDVTAGPDDSLFKTINISYDDFAVLPIDEKMRYVRAYAKRRIALSGDYLWWIEDGSFLNAKINFLDSFTEEDKKHYKSIGILLAPECLSPNNLISKYGHFMEVLLDNFGLITASVKSFLYDGRENLDLSSSLGKSATFNLIKDNIASVYQESNSLPDILFTKCWGKNIKKEKRFSYWLDQITKITANPEILNLAKNQNLI